MKTINISKTLYKVLYLVNQQAKNLYPFYTLTLSGIYPSKLKLNRGESKCYIGEYGEVILSELGLSPSDNGVIFNSAELFRIYKEYKTKGFTSLLIDGDKIIFKEEDKNTQIGKIINVEESLMGHELYDIIDNNVDMKVSTMNLSLDELDRLRCNECLRYNYNGYKLILTKELFPGIKKKNISGKCVVIPTDDEFFLLLTVYEMDCGAVKKGENITMEVASIYRCINF